jgi:hypothetical protein
MCVQSSVTVLRETKETASFDLLHVAWRELASQDLPPEYIDHAAAAGFQAGLEIAEDGLVVFGSFKEPKGRVETQCEVI